MSKIPRRRIAMRVSGSFDTLSKQAWDVTLGATINLSTITSAGVMVHDCEETHFILTPYAGASVISASDLTYARQGDKLILNGVGDAGGGTSITFSSTFMNVSTIAPGAGKVYWVEFRFDQSNQKFIKVNEYVEP